LGGKNLFTALDLSDPKNLNSFLNSLILPLMETYKYRREVKALLKYTAVKIRRMPRKIKLKGTKSK
jgi:hypothetical protein